MSDNFEFANQALLGESADKTNDSNELSNTVAGQVTDGNSNGSEVNQNTSLAGMQIPLTGSGMDESYLGGGIITPVDDKTGMKEDEAPKRPVSNTRRAAQNRSAQKAFRQRKERYIKDLEAQAAEVPGLKQAIEDLKAENLRLRDYTIALQGRIIELGNDNFPNPNTSVVASSGSNTNTDEMYNKILKSRQ